MTNSNDFLSSAAAVKEEVNIVDQTVIAEEKSESVINTLVGDGKKFSSVDALAKAKLDADEHIKRIERENAEYRKKLESSDANYQQILDKLSKSKTNVSNDHEDAEITSEKSNVNLDTWFETKLSERDRKIHEQANMAKARDLMVQTYGSVEVARQVRDELLKVKPYMKTALDNLVVSDPETFVKEVTAFKAPTEIRQSSIDPVSSLRKGETPKGSQYMTWSEANEVRRKSLKEYNSKEFQDRIEASRKYYTQSGKDYFTT